MNEQELTIRELIRTVRILQQQVEQLTGESQIVKLDRGQPRQIVALRRIHPNSNYYIHREVLTAEGGEAGDLLITQKKRNGFALTYTGTAERVTVDLWIQDRPE